MHSEGRHQLLLAKSQISGMTHTCHLLKHHLYRCTIHYRFASIFTVSLNGVVAILKTKMSWD